MKSKTELEESVGTDQLSISSNFARSIVNFFLRLLCFNLRNNCDFSVNIIFFFQSDCMKSCRNFANTQAMLYTSSVLVMIYIHTLSLHRQNRHMRRKRHMKKSISVTSYIYSAWLSQSWLGKIASFMRSIRPAHEATCVPCVRPVRGHPPPDAHGSRGRPPGSG